MAEEKVPTWTVRRMGPRGLSMATAGVVMLVVIVLVGAGGYFAFNNNPTNGSSSSQSVTNCQPVTSPICKALPSSAGHDATLFVPFSAAQTGSVVPFTASVPSSAGTASSYFFNFGDGTNATSTTPTVNHVYASPGSYIASTIVTAGGAAHDSYHSLTAITISASFTTSDAPNQPGVTGAVTANTTSSTGATAIIAPGGTVTVSGAYTGAPTNPDYEEQSPTISAGPGAVLSGTSNTTTSASGTATFASAGIYWVEFAGSAKSVSTSSTVAQNYVFTVFVSPTGVNAGTIGAASSKSQHTGSLVVYELVPGGATSEDPAIDYETAGYEPIQNVYENLISYNGSQTGPTFSSYVPVIAACVPGSDVGANNCMTTFGSTLINGDNYTFVISQSAHFYDPATQKSWEVYPTDVLFSIARTEGFSVLPCFGCNNGWIIAQSLLPTGNGNWDNGFHGARNNTPQNVYSSIILNGTDCPSAAMSAPYNGCVTFDAHGAGQSWPYFLELIADPLGGSIVPCSWFTAQGAGIPYWTIGNATNDAPCAAPGQNGFGLAPGDVNLPATGWDNWEYGGSGANSGQFIGNVQWNLAGSGPYYMNQYSIAAAYNLQANPAYQGNPLCTWAGCWPAATTTANPTYAASVSVTWESSQVPGEAAYQTGVADFASIPSTDTGLLLQLIAQGKIKTADYPSLAIDFMPFNFDFNVAGAQRYTTNPITVQSDVFSYVGLRQFVAHAYPYGTIQSTINTKDGIQYAFNYGGAIPQFMANYYPTNVSWPTGDPDTNPADVGGAAWWWAQATNPSSPFYDSELSVCTTSSPCQFPLFGETGAPDLDQRINLWASEINSLTGGKLQANPLDINFVDLVINSLYSGPYQNAMPLYRLGWLPDYPDPTDYMVPLYYPDSSYTASDTVLEQTNAPTFNSGSCHAASDWTWWASNVTAMGGVANDCQGAAYNAMVIGMKLAAVMPAGAARVLAYNEVEQIANGLALYAYTFQQSIVVGSASYINPSSVDANVTVVGYDQTWFSINGNGVY